MAKQRNLYEILGVDKGASPEEIKAAYRRLARKHHPDLNAGDKAAEERFKEASAAFDVLSDKEQRARYDQFGQDGLRSGFDPEQARAWRQWQARASGQGGNQFEFDLGDLFGDLLSGGGGGRGPFSGFSRRPARGEDVEAQLSLPLLETVRGVERELTLDLPERGRVRLTVKVPPGVDEGNKVRLAGQGLPGRHGGPPGDLLLSVRVEPHPRLRREGSDLHLTVPVTVAEAMLGARIEVPTPFGPVKLKVPPGSQGGTRLRLKGRGVRGRNGRPAGHLYVTLEIHVPDAQTDPERARSAAEALEELYAADVRAGLEL